MIGFFRSFFQSKIGLFVTMCFVAIIAVAFASSDVSSGFFGGVSGSQTVANVGDETVTTSQLRRDTNQEYEAARRNNPSLTLPQFLGGDTMDQLIGRLVDGYVISEYGKLVGMGTGKRLIDGEIAGIQTFADVQGNFDEQAYRAQLQAQGITETDFRGRVSRALFAEQLLSPLAFGLEVPTELVKTYAQITLQSRRGRIAAVPSTLFLDEKPVDDKVLQDFYAENADKFTIPEQRRIRYAVFNRAQVVESITFSESEVKAAFEQRREEFAARETRSISQVILPTEDGANALVASIAGGASIERAATDIGLAVSNLGPLTKGELSDQASNAVADAVFGAEKDQIANIAQSGLGWHVTKINQIDKIAERTLEDVREQLERDVREEKSRQALSDFTVSLEEQLEEGVSLDTLTRNENLELKTSPLVTASGIAPKDREYQADPVVRILLQDAFQLQEDSNGRLKETTPGQEYVLFDVPNIVAAAPPPFSENKQAIETAYRFDKASDEAEKIARQISDKTKDAETLAQAIADTGLTLPPVENVGANREQLAQSGQRVPPPLALMFSMKEGSSKVLEGPANQIWYIVFLEKIDQGDLDARPDVIAAANRDLSAAYGGELQQQFVNAMREELDIVRNETVIKAVKDELTGVSSSR